MLSGTCGVTFVVTVVATVVVVAIVALSDVSCLTILSTFLFGNGATADIICSII